MTTGPISTLPGKLPADVTDALRPLETVGLTRANGAKKVGGKAAQLGRLARDGLPVPRGWCIEAKVFSRQVDLLLPRDHSVASLIKLAGNHRGDDRAARARDRLLAAPIPQPLHDAIEALWNAVGDHLPVGLSVRSSATCEDQKKTSLAGLATTVLAVRGPKAIEAAIRQVWASLYLPRTLSYLANNDVRDASMGVILQAMVPAKAAGVLFTAPPPGLTSDRFKSNERLVHVTYGLGAPVVDGATSADSIRFDLRGKLVEYVVGEKTVELQATPDGPQTVPLDTSRRRARVIDDQALVVLSQLATRLEATASGPLDVEFAIEDVDGAPEIHVLQSRPLTGGAFPEGGDAQTVWSRANVGEALPGAATPLTWSIAREFSDRGFRDAFSALGCKVPKGTVLVSNVNGRFYLNLTQFMRISAQVPGLSPRALLTASGGASAEAIAMLGDQASTVSKRSFLMRAPLVLPGLFRRYARLSADVVTFEEAVQKQRRRLRGLDLGILPDDGLATTLRGVRGLLDETGGLMLSCASASLATHLALRAALEAMLTSKVLGTVRGVPEEGMPASSAAIEAMLQNITGGIADVDSAGPGIALLAVAEQARADEAVRTGLLDGSLRTLDDFPQGPAKSALLRFLDDHGDRAVREAELATPRWQEDPRPVLAMLAAALRSKATPELALAKARATADRELARLEETLSLPELRTVRALVTANNHFTRLRERMRTWVSRVLGMLRHVALEIDARLRRIEPELPEGSVFFCTFAELTGSLASGRAELGHVVRLRRAQHARDRARPDPPPSFVGRPPPLQLPPAPGPRWEGLAASGGVVEGRAHVLSGDGDYQLLEPGEILVARTTDVGMSPLFLIAAGVVTELGGPLSHAAIVAREYAVPAVVNVTDATVVISTGDRLRVDGDRGVVEKLEP